MTEHEREVVARLRSIAKEIEDGRWRIGSMSDQDEISMYLSKEWKRSVHLFLHEKEEKHDT